MIFAGGTLILTMNSSAQYTPNTHIDTTQFYTKAVDAVVVTDGGTGDTTLTAHEVLLGEGTSNVAVTGAGTAGQVLTSNKPVSGVLSSS